MAMDPVVHTAHGSVRGRLDNGVCSFKGLPYAASTGGAHRFMPPQPLRAWAGIRDALDFGQSAPQAPVRASERAAFAKIVEPVSEDCLSLNIYTSAPFAGHRRPVMVWLHGGAWLGGCGSAPALNGAKLAKFGEVVVVTINHRLNVFGYLLLEDTDSRFADSANVGVLDMVAALQWVKENIHAFGGDSRNVTIFGQSGGGSKVSALMAAPAARGLFHKAIAQSCSGSLKLCQPEEARRLSQQLVERLGRVALTGESLQRISLSQLLAATTGSFRPVLDGRTFTRHPFDPDAPAISSDIPFMAGNAATETRIQMAATDPNNFALDATEVRRRLARFLRLDAGEVAKIFAVYEAAYPIYSPGDLLACITTDYIYIRNTRREATLQSLSGRAPVYTYVFTRQTPVMGGLLRSPHESEVAFIFGTAPAAEEMVGTGKDIEPLTHMMISTWATFAHKGDPNNATVPVWPRHDSVHQRSMLLNVNSTVADDPGGEARSSLGALPYFEYSMPTNYTRA